MSAHTPGPWFIGNESNECCDVETGKTVISLDRHDPFMSGVIIITRDEMLANAHLIAAAPDLLKALKAVFQHATTGCVADDTDWEAVRAAIAKAEGVS